MVRLNSKTLMGVFVSFLIILALIAIVRAVFPGALSGVDGFTNMSCYGVKCAEGEFCQEGCAAPSILRTRITIMIRAYKK